MERNKTLYGVPVARGVAIGRAFLRDDGQGLGEESLSGEGALSRILAVLDEAANEMRESSRLLPIEVKRMTEAQIAILEDSGFRDSIKKGLESGLPPDQSISKAMEAMASKLESSSSEYMKERAGEMRGLAREIIRLLTGRRPIPDDAVLVCEDITVPEALRAVNSGVKAVIMERGAVTSHGVIILRDYHIPTLIEVFEATKVIQEGTTLAVDGSGGMLIVDPDEETLASFQEKIADEKREQEELEKLVGIETKTLNGHRVEIMMNLDLPEEIALVEKVKKCGVGLFRTEYLFLTGRRDEESQFRIYRNMAEAVHPYVFTVRTFDLGGDKVVGIQEANPFLGMRGIRFLMARPDMFKAQLRAAVRANELGNLRIMFPMVSSLSELASAKALYQEVVDELSPEHVPALGIMVEVPSVVMMADEFAREVEFMSIGTNDLTQYTLAVDRQNFRVSHLYQQIDPAVLRGVHRVIEAGRSAGIPVSVCGELASDPVGALVLMSLGVRELSVSPPNYLRAKKMILNLKVEDMDMIRDSILSARTPEEIRRMAHWLIKQKGIPA
ncbi:MAG: phosphoenolpyruvate--protein phosphotransferase [candidate division WOR-3 bacterium]